MNRSLVMSPVIVVDSPGSVKPARVDWPTARRRWCVAALGDALGSCCGGAARGTVRLHAHLAHRPSTSMWSPVSTTRSMSQSTKATAPTSTGLPEGAGRHAMPSNLSASLTANRDETSAWS